MSFRFSLDTMGYTPAPTPSRAKNKQLSRPKHSFPSHQRVANPAATRRDPLCLSLPPLVVVRRSALFQSKAGRARGTVGPRATSLSLSPLSLSRGTSPRSSVRPSLRPACSVTPLVRAGSSRAFSPHTHKIILVIAENYPFLPAPFGDQ